MQNHFKQSFHVKEILMKDAHKGGSDDVEAPSSSFYKIRWSLKQTYQIFAFGARRKCKFTPFGDLERLIFAAPKPPASLRIKFPIMSGRRTS